MSENSADHNQPAIPHINLPRQRQDSTGRRTPQIPGPRQGERDR